jgi:DNA-binding LacI/PurR family transcriptional regulator
VEGGLTTVAQPVPRIASTLLDLLGGSGEGSDGTGGGVLLPGEIVIRGSARLDLSRDSPGGS